MKKRASILFLIILLSLPVYSLDENLIYLSPETEIRESGFFDNIKEFLGISSLKTFEGYSEVYVIEDFIRNKAEYEIFLKNENQEIKLIFPDNNFPQIISGEKIRVKGNLINEEGISSSEYQLEVSSLEILEEGSVSSEDNPNLGEQRVAVILLNFKENPEIPAQSIDEMKEYFFGKREFRGEKSVNDWIIENSHGKAHLTGDVFGYYDIDDKSEIVTNCDYRNIFEKAIELSDKDIDFSKYNRIVVFHPYINSCGYGGIAFSFGMSNVPSFGSEEGDIIATRQMINGLTTYSTRVIAHEFGHNFGLYHARDLECEEKTLRSIEDCEFREYGDGLDVMGFGVKKYSERNKEIIGWLGYENKLTINLPEDQNKLNKEYQLYQAHNNLKSDALTSLVLVDNNYGYFLERHNEVEGIFNQIIIIPSGGYSLRTEKYYGSVIRVVSLKDFKGSSYLLDLSPHASNIFETYTDSLNSYLTEDLPFCTKDFCVSLIEEAEDYSKIYLSTLFTCGNSIKEYGEECDDGNQIEGDIVAGDYCNNDCTLNLRACSDGKDNDLDGKIDFQEDPGCNSPVDSTETSLIECSDGQDNDLDGKIDFQNDPDCYSYLDESEKFISAQCNDKKDNDFDGKIDYPNDPSCSDRSDNSENQVDVYWKTQCNDGIDNDGDGLIDFGFSGYWDRSCKDFSDNDEFPIDRGVFPCDDGIDNDLDKYKDFNPNSELSDPDCIDFRNSEINYNPPQCSDRIDNDFDGLIDMDDAGCSSLKDLTEEKNVRVASCIDTDEQIQNENDLGWVYSPGEIILKGSFYSNDKCIDSETINELSCYSGKMYSEERVCPIGTMCKTDLAGRGYCSLASCSQDGNFLEKDKEVNINGLKIILKEILDSETGRYVQININSNTNIFMKPVFDSYFPDEYDYTAIYSINIGKIKYKFYSEIVEEQPYLNVFKCVSADYCSDTDAFGEFANGLNYYIKGSAAFGSPNAVIDVCLPSDPKGKRLIENSCVPNEYNLQYHYYDCPNGCKEGKCICLSNEECPSNYACFKGSCIKANVCGNGILERNNFTNEECDDGNTLNNDDCSKECKIETFTENCYDSDEGINYQKQGTAQKGYQQVKDSCIINQIEGDYILKEVYCKDDDIQYLISCYGADKECIEGACVNLKICGNSLKEDNEECDDGNIVNGDGCDSVCKTEIATASEEFECLETDRGIDYEQSGYVSIGSEKFQDACWKDVYSSNSKSLIEYYCNRDSSEAKAERKIYSCEDSCENGKCVNLQQSPKPKNFLENLLKK